MSLAVLTGHKLPAPEKKEVLVGVQKLRPFNILSQKQVIKYRRGFQFCFDLLLHVHCAYVE